MMTKEPSLNLLNEMTLLNNELVNTQRILIKQNAEITNLNLQLKLVNAELNQFTFAASHDMREPLRMINSFMQKLENDYAHQLDDKAKRYIHFAADGSKRMMTLITELLDYASVGNDDLHKELTDVNGVIEEVLKMQEAVILEKDAAVSFTQMPELRAFKTGLKILFQNLISNALKFTPAGTKPCIHISATEINDHWQFAVSDNGLGINPAAHQQIFKLFKKLHSREAYPGTGMGLATCEKIVNRHGGTIWVQSAEGKGSTFYFTLIKQFN